MKVLLVHNFYQQPGGEDVVFRAERELLRRHGHEVRQYTDYNDRIRQMSHHRLFRETLWSTTTLRRLEQLLREWQPDVVHFHNTFPLISPAAYYACRRAGVPVVQTLHNYRLLCPAATFYRAGRVCEACLSKTFLFPAIRFACYRNSRIQSTVVAMMLLFHRGLRTWQKQVDIFIALTEFARSKFLEGGLPAERVMVKPNFIYPDPGKNDRNNATGEYVLFVGRLSEEKGIRVLLQAWKNLPNVILKIAGDGPLQEVVRQQITHCGQIEYLGHCDREKILFLMKGAQFLVFPSEWYEGFPMTIAEAFACGIPVIASSLGAMAEIIEDGRTGLLFNPGDARDLAAKVEWAWTHPEKMCWMGKSARKSYEIRYSANKNYDMLMKIYQQTIKVGNKK